MMITGPQRVVRMHSGNANDVTERLDAGAGGVEDALTVSGDFAGFRILKQLGSGGMGQVFLAEQQVPLTRRVALKLMRAAVITADMASRFAIEQQSLARLEHPAIARLYEAGTTQAGFPWFAMELVEGQTLTAYADQAHLTIEDRVQLFLAICEGVRHAHRRGILHRDLKPDNILVVEIDGRPHPKIIDFGIAKALDQPAGGRSLTGAEIIGTPAYLAPEALDVVHGVDLDTRADVYALGVILYELLAGVRPHALTGTSLLQVVREVAEHDAPTPATRYAGLDAANRERIAAARGLSAPALQTLLNAEPGWIAAHAVAREREERYGSVEELAADLQRWLRLEPVSVAPPSAWYRLKKLLQRRRGPALAVAAVFLSLVAGVVAFSLAAARADREAAAAQLARTEAERISAFMLGLFEQADPSRSRGNSLTAREILDSGAERVRTELSDQPQLRGVLLRTLGSVYDSLGLYPQAEPLLVEALAQAHTTRERALALLALGRLRAMQGDYNQASTLMQQSLTLADSIAETLSPEERVELLNRYGISERLQRHMDASESLHRRELALRVQLTGAAHPSTARAYYALAYIAYQRNYLLSAELLLKRTIAIYEQFNGADHASLAGPMRTLADLYDEQGRSDLSEPLYLRSLAITERVYGPDHPNVALQANNLGVSYYLQDRLDEALVFLQRALAINEKRLPADHPELGNPNLNLGLVYLKRGEYAQAESRFRKVLSLWQERAPADEPNWGWVWWGLGEVCRLTDRGGEAAEWLHKAQRQWQATLPGDREELARVQASLDALTATPP